MNPCGKSRKTDRPYAKFANVSGWEWLVLKTYQTPQHEIHNPYARWFCAVKSPFTYGSYELGDTYVKDVLQYSELVENTDEFEAVAIAWGVK